MRQQRKPGTRKTRLREDNQFAKGNRAFTGTCSKCGAKKTDVVKFKNAQVCVSNCLSGAITRLGGAPPVPADQVIKAE
jgi:hypothetical protein